MVAGVHVRFRFPGPTPTAQWRQGSLRRPFPHLSHREEIVEAIRPNSPAKGVRGRRPWVSPIVADLPRLTDLTLSTGDAIPGSGGTGGGGSTVTP